MKHLYKLTLKNEDIGFYPTTLAFFFDGDTPLGKMAVCRRNTNESWDVYILLTSLNRFENLNARIGNVKLSLEFIYHYDIDLTTENQKELYQDLEACEVKY